MNTHHPPVIQNAVSQPLLSHAREPASRRFDLRTLGIARTWSSFCLLAALWFGCHATALADVTNLAVVADTYILSDNPNNNAGGFNLLIAGTTGANDGTAGTRRGLLRFDLSGIPAGSTITSAVLQLKLNMVTFSGTVDSTFDVYRLQADWGEGSKGTSSGLPASNGEATWNDSMSGVAGWSAPGALSDAAAVASASTPVGSVAGVMYSWTGASVISDVQFWLDNPSQDFGWLLKSQSEGTQRTARGFGSKESGAAAGVLVVGYETTQVISDPIAERIPKGDITIELQTIADGMAAPLGMAVPDDDSGRMFVYDQQGVVWVVASSGRLATPLLDVRDRLVQLGAYDERGLLGLAVHQDFSAHPFIYTYTSEPYDGTADFQNGLGTTNDHQSVIAEWRISAGDSNVVNVASRREILRVDEPQSNHNGGSMHFGPDGNLYVVLGDGGAANDVATGHVEGGNAQDVNRIWGKMIRIDVDGSNSANGQYGVPADNPFVGLDGIDEVWAYGLRNPFSFGFEKDTGTLYLADVGQNKVEEINIITAGGNYGWNVKEGTFWFDGTGNVVTAPVRPVPPDLIDPIAEYDHDDGLAVICGFVYHGSAIPALADRFAFGDWGSFSAPSGRLFYLDETNGVNELRLGMEDRPLGMWLRGYGQDTDGELYVFCSRQLGPTGSTGRMLKLVAPPEPLAMTGISASGTNVTATWTGGAGVTALQRKSTLMEPVWANDTVTNAQSATTAQWHDTGFFRTLDAGHVPPIPLTTYMTSAAERPTTNDSPALGTGTFLLDGNSLTFNIRYAGLTASASAAHIHGPAGAAQSGGVLISLEPYNGGQWGTNGTLSGVIVLSDAQKAMLLDGKTYVNIHTSTHSGGEIRGQIAPVNFQVSLSGANENQPISTQATGLGNLTLVGNELTMNLTYGALSGPATAAHIHGPATRIETTNVLVNLAPLNGGSYGSEGSLSGTVTLSPTQLAYVIDGLTYINFHTSAHSGGEMRGQILPQATGMPLTAQLSGLAEHPPLTGDAAGSGTFSLEGSTLNFNIEYSGLSGPAIAAHIHGATNTTQDAGVLISLAPFNGGAFGTNGTFSGSVVVTPTQRNDLLSGLTYVNIHTSAHSGGEVRGQIAPVAMFSSLSGINERPLPVATPGVGSGTLALVRDRLSLNVTYSGLLSAATMSHIHGPAGLFQSAGVLAGLDGLNGGSYSTKGSLAGSVTLDVTDLLNVIDGQTYINIHTTDNPSGEIRGQIMR